MYDKTAKSLKRRKRLCAILSLFGLGLAFIPLRAVTIPLGIILCFFIYLALSLLLVARPINKALLYEMDAERFLFLSYELGYGGSVCDIYADYYRGKYDKAIEIINDSIPKTKRNVFKYEYYTYLAYCYFEKGDMDRLKNACDTLKLMPCKSKSERALRADTECIIEFLLSFAAGDYAVCKEMNIIESASENFKSVPALLNKLKLYHGIACHMNGNTEESSALFSEVAEACPGLYFSKLAESYLNGNAEAKENNEDNLFATIGDIKRQNKKALYAKNKKSAKAKRIIVAVGIPAVMLVLILIAVDIIGIGDAFSRPADPYTVIAENDAITRVVDLVPINADGDALCIYLTDGQYTSGLTQEGYYSQILGIAYLNRVDDGLYRYGASVKFQQAEKWVDSSLYKISAPDISKDVYFKIVSAKGDIPSDAMITKEFYVREKAYCLCYMYAKDSEASEYSFEVVPDP